MTPVAADRERRWDGPGIVLIAGVLLAMTLIAAPVLLREQTRDWIAYEQAAERLEAGEPLYVWELATEDDEYYLYPPGMAAAWAVAGSPELLLVVKVLSLLAVGVLAPLVVRDPSRRAVAAVVIALGAVLWAPNLYDLILANVMALYVGALSIVIARRGWLGAVPLGIVLALAAKPAIFPFAIWLLVTRPRDALRVAAVAIGVSVVIALGIGPDRYLEYLAALPQTATVATDFTGNVGLITWSPAAALVGLLVAVGLGAFAGLRLDERRGAAVALGAMLLAQPTIGFNYAGVLYPALVLLWGADRIAGVIAFVVATPMLLLSPVLAAVVTIVAAIVSWVARGATSGREVPT